jgi:hypothetical protein
MLRAEAPRHRKTAATAASSSRGQVDQARVLLQELRAPLAGIPIKKEGFRMFYGPLRDVPLEEWVDAGRISSARRACTGTWRLGVGSQGQRDAKSRRPLRVLRRRREVRRKCRAWSPRTRTRSSRTRSTTRARRSPCFLAQEADAAEYLADQFRQARKAWWLHLTSAWGLRTNARGVACCRCRRARVRDEIEAEARRSGPRPQGRLAATRRSRRRACSRRAAGTGTKASGSTSPTASNDNAPAPSHRLRRAVARRRRVQGRRRRAPEAVRGADVAEERPEQGRPRAREAR